MCSSDLPRFNLGVYDSRITQGYIGVLVSVPADKASFTERLLQESGAEDIKKEGQAGR